MSAKLVKPTIVFKVTVLAASIAVLGSFLMGYFISHAATDVVYKDEVKYLGFVTHAKAQDLMNRTATLVRDVTYLAGTPPVLGIPRSLENAGIDPEDESTIEEWKMRLGTIFSELSRAKPFYQQIRYIGVADQGRELVRVNNFDDGIQVVPENELQQKAQRPYFINGLKVSPDEVFLSSIELNREHGEVSLPRTPVIRAVKPIMFRGEVFGLVIINMDLRPLFQQLASQVPDGAEVYLVNQNGYFLEHQDASKTFGFEFGKDIRIQQMYQNFDPAQEVAIYKNEYHQQQDTDVVHLSRAFYDKLDEDRYVAVLLAVPQQSLIDKSAEIRRTILQLVLVLMLISILAAGLLARRLIKPLRLITQASEDLVQGNEVDYLPLEQRDEIGDLARSFENMRHQLQDKNKELLESQAQSHHANKLASLGEMASGMAHEINTPIQTINLIAQRVRRRKDKLSYEDIGDDMDKICDNINKVSQIIESLRKVSRNSSRDDFAMVKVGEVLDDALQITRERFRIRGIDFKCIFRDIDRDTEIECKRISVAQILINLLNNAHDEVAGMNPAWIELEVSASNGDVMFSMTDSGHGIPADIQGKLFEPLFTTKEIGKGTGLGLSISREIARNHHGDLYYDATVEHTRFVLIIPRKQRQNDNQHFGGSHG